MRSIPLSSKLGRIGFFGDRSSQFLGAVAVGGLTGDCACPHVCCTVAVLSDELSGACAIVDVGDSGGLMFVTNNGPIFPAGIGDPGGSGASRRGCDSKNPGVDCDAGLDSNGVLNRSSGASLVSRECEVEPYCEWAGVIGPGRVVMDANGSSPMSDALLSAPASPPRNELGGARPPAVGPMTSSTMRLRSTALDAFTSGSTSALGCPGGGQTASRKMEPVSARIPSR